MTIYTLEQIEKAKATAEHLRSQIYRLSTEVERLKVEIGTGEEKVLQAILDGKNAKEIRQAHNANLIALQDVARAIVLAKQQLKEAEAIADYESLAQFKKDKADFMRRLLAFCDGPLAKLLKEFEPLDTEGWALWQLGNELRDEPVAEIQFLQVLSPLGKVAIPQDLEILRERFEGYLTEIKKSR